MLYIGCSAQLSSAQLARTYVRTANERTKERTTQTDRPKRRTLSSRALPKTKRACAPARSQPDAHAHFFVTHARTHVRTYAPTVRPTDRPTDRRRIYVPTYPRFHSLYAAMHAILQQLALSFTTITIASQPASQSVSQSASHLGRKIQHPFFIPIYTRTYYLSANRYRFDLPTTYLSIYLSIYPFYRHGGSSMPSIHTMPTHTHTHTHTHTNKPTHETCFVNRCMRAFLRVNFLFSFFLSSIRP
jgi:hypothetical protein